VHIFLGDGTDVNILAGNTGNMAAKTYIYYNGTTTLQTTTDPDDIGATHVLVAVAQNGATLASVQVVGGTTWISGDWINTGTITAAKLNVTALSAITADMGTLTAGTIQTAAAGNNRIVINIADGIVGYNAADVVQFQLDPADGKAYAGAGAVMLDASGVSITGGVGVANAVKWYSGGDLLATIYGCDADPLRGSLVMGTYSYDGADYAHTVLFADGHGALESPTVILASGITGADTSYIYLEASQVQIVSGDFRSAATIATDLAGNFKWRFWAYNAGTTTDTGTIMVTINDVLYYLLARLPP